jgi:chromatin remodeling complex protein RSC6
MPPAAKKTTPQPAAPVTKAAPVPAPVEKPVAKKAAAAKVEKPAVVATPVPATPATQAAPVAATATPCAGESIFASLTEKVNSVTAQIKEIQNMIKLLSKEYDKQQKIIDKVQKKRQNAKNSPSGFAKPNKISNELCDFIGVPYGTEKSRTDITRFINAYVKEHNLNNPNNRRFIIPDAKLKVILNVKDGEEINYFILQKLISHHFPPSASKAKA